MKKKNPEELFSVIKMKILIVVLNNINSYR